MRGLETRELPEFFMRLQINPGGYYCYLDGSTTTSEKQRDAREKQTVPDNLGHRWLWATSSLVDQPGKASTAQRGVKHLVFSPSFSVGSSHPRHQPHHPSSGLPSNPCRPRKFPNA